MDLYGSSWIPAPLFVCEAGVCDLLKIGVEGTGWTGMQYNIIYVPCGVFYASEILLGRDVQRRGEWERGWLNS